MKTFLKFTVLSAVLLMLAGGLSSCNDINYYQDCEDSHTRHFYVVSSNCGYLLKGSHPSIFTNDFYLAINLPRRYRTQGLPVIVTYCSTGENSDTCGALIGENGEVLVPGFPIINVITIQRR